MVKQFNDPQGFNFCESELLDAIKRAVDLENPCHSGTSLALCLQKCKIILNSTFPKEHFSKSAAKYT
jgi:hypothetical protein